MERDEVEQGHGERMDGDADLVVVEPPEPDTGPDDAPAPAPDA